MGWILPAANEWLNYHAPWLQVVTMLFIVLVNILLMSL
jgi:hypothetical protein